ncbi:MAG TPA: phosphatase PAP2 family protein [Vicinamibacterales bacterium]
MPLSLLLPCGYFVAFAIAAATMRATRPGWFRTFSFGVAGAGLAGAGLLLPDVPAAGSTLREWWPLLLVPFAYWAPAGLTGAPHVTFERWLQHTDERFDALTRARDTARVPVLDELLEVAYLLVYPTVPAGFLAFSWSDGSGAGFWPPFWAAVLPCYALLPLLPTRTPRERRALTRSDSVDTRSRLRRVNEEVLRTFSNRWNTFPSGHASAAAAVAALLWRVESPRTPAFVLLAAGIALGAVRGRYHYLADSVAGAALGLAAGLLL